MRHTLINDDNIFKCDFKEVLDIQSVPKADRQF